MLSLRGRRNRGSIDEMKTKHLSNSKYEYIIQSEFLMISFSPFCLATRPSFLK